MEIQVGITARPSILANCFLDLQACVCRPDLMFVYQVVEFMCGGASREEDEESAPSETVDQNLYTTLAFEAKSFFFLF